MTINLKCGARSSAVLIPERGGLLSSLTLENQAAQGVSLLWLPDDFNLGESGWPGGGMPLMFPFAGRVFHGSTPLQYELDGQVWPMPLHGFAYAERWQVQQQGSDSATLMLRSSEASRAFFPFDFTVTATYQLSKSKLQTEVTVTCDRVLRPSVQSMPVALGWHPYFRLPLNSATAPGNLRLLSSAKKQIRVTPTGAAGKSAPFPDLEDGDVTDLSNPLLANLILGDMKEQNAQLIDNTNHQTIHLDWSEETRYLVLWTKPGHGFHCVEPWMGLPDALNNGEGLAWLAPGKTLSFRFAIALS